MKLYQNTMIGLRHRGWTRTEATAYFMKGAARELHIAPDLFSNLHKRIRIRNFIKKWLKYNNGMSYFDICGMKLPNVSGDHSTMSQLLSLIQDDYLIFTHYNDCYQKSLIDFLDGILSEGPSCYANGNFDVTVKHGDIIIDAGAWIGDFSAYAASKGATSYAFEPVNKTYQWLCETKKLNNVKGGGVIHPIPKGLGNNECEMDISLAEENGANSLYLASVSKHVKNSFTCLATEKIPITTLDKFVDENKLKRVDFIKADIEGAERDMLHGAANVLKTFAPKLAICTYHLPDDPEVLEKIIKEANPDYTVVHLRHKLFACVVHRPMINKIRNQNTDEIE